MLNDRSPSGRSPPAIRSDWTQDEGPCIGNRPDNLPHRPDRAHEVPYRGRYQVPPVQQVDGETNPRDERMPGDEDYSGLTRGRGNKQTRSDQYGSAQPKGIASHSTQGSSPLPRNHAIGHCDQRRIPLAREALEVDDLCEVVEERLEAIVEAADEDDDKKDDCEP